MAEPDLHEWWAESEDQPSHCIRAIDYMPLPRYRPYCVSAGWFRPRLQDRRPWDSLSQDDEPLKCPACLKEICAYQVRWNGD